MALWSLKDLLMAEIVIKNNILHEILEEKYSNRLFKISQLCSIFSLEL